MHYCALSAGLALSTVKRTSGGVVINEWKPFTLTFKKLKTCIQDVFGKTSKERFKAYKEYLSKMKHDVIMVDLPNDTRVAGVHITIKGSLRSYHALRKYATECSRLEDKMPSREQWNQMAEFEAIMSHSMNLCFVSQGDRVALGGEMVLALILGKVKYKYEQDYNVVDIQGRSWPADTPFDKLPRKKMQLS